MKYPLTLRAPAATVCRGCWARGAPLAGPPSSSSEELAPAPRRGAEGPRTVGAAREGLLPPAGGGGLVAAFIRASHSYLLASDSARRTIREFSLWMGFEGLRDESAMSRETSPSGASPPFPAPPPFCPAGEPKSHGSRTPAFRAACVAARSSTRHSSMLMQPRKLGSSSGSLK